MAPGVDGIFLVIFSVLAELVAFPKHAFTDLTDNVPDTKLVGY
jgi:hypothetical protein